MIDVQLTNAPVRFTELSPIPAAAGGECVFLGRTRSETHPKHGQLRRLSYEAYEPMAAAVLATLARAAAERFGCVSVRLHHALGEVPVGQASVLVQTICPHRAEAFDACRFLIDHLKTEAPIWKREVWADGTTWSSGQPVAMSQSP